ncbi:MAG: DUF3887 domain-containing protein [Oscillospiraceae bacterium]
MKTTLYKFAGFAGALLLCMVLLAGCGSGSLPLPAWADGEALTTKAETVLDDLNAKNYSAVTAHFKEVYRASLTDESWASQFTPIFEKTGAFQEYTKTQLLGTKEDSGVEYAVVLLTAKYEKTSITYRLVFDTDSDLVGLFL